MTGTGGARKYELLSSWNQSFSKDFFEVDLKEKSSELQHFALAETRSPVILVRLCFPWNKVQHSEESHDATENLQGYSKPAAWKRILRKLRAEARKIQLSCCEGMCLPREVPDYTSHSYRKNFDIGRQYSQQQSSTYVQKPWGSSCNRSYVRQFAVQVDPLWQRRNLVAPSKLQVESSISRPLTKSRPH